MTGLHRKRLFAIVNTALWLVAGVALASPAFADKLTATKYRPVNKRLTFPANAVLPAVSPLTERQLLDSGYLPFGVVSVVLRASSCKTVNECEWFDESVDANLKAREIAAQHGADVVTLWSDNLEFVRTQSPNGLARLGAPKDCEQRPVTNVFRPGKTEYEVRCTFDSDFMRRTLYMESRGIVWHSSRSEQAGENARKAVKLLNGLYRKDHNRSYLRAINFGNEAVTDAPAAQSESPASRDDIEDTATLPPLLQAARDGNIEVVRAELDRGIEVSTATARGNTAVHFSAAAGHEQIAQLLIARGAPWQQRNRNGAPALYLAARYGHLTTVVALLDAGADINEQSLNFIDLTPAMVAAKYEHAALLEALLDRGAEIDRKDKEGQDILTHAVTAGHDALIVPLLARMGPELRKQALKSALYVAVIHSKPAAVDVLLQQGALTEYRYTTAISREYTPLLIAAAERHLEVTRVLLAAGADSNAKTGVGNALSLAVRSHQHSKPEALESGAALAVLLLQAGADPNQRRVLWDVRMAAPEERSGHEALIDYLLGDGILERGDLQVLYARAVRAGRMDYMRRIATLAGEDMVPADDPALLSAAVHSGNVPTVDHVLARGTDVNRVLNKQQETAIILAAKRLDLPMAAFLLDQGADPKRTNKRGQSAISLAYAQNDLRMVKKLSTFDADLVSGAKR